VILREGDARRFLEIASRFASSEVEAAALISLSNSRLE